MEQITIKPVLSFLSFTWLPHFHSLSLTLKFFLRETFLIDSSSQNLLPTYTKNKTESNRNKT